MAGWHHWLNGHESGWTPGVGDGQGGLACYNSWGRKEPDMTDRLNGRRNRRPHLYFFLSQLMEPELLSPPTSASAPQPYLPFAGPQTHKASSFLISPHFCPLCLEHCTDLPSIVQSLPGSLLLKAALPDHPMEKIPFLPRLPYHHPHPLLCLTLTWSPYYSVVSCTLLLID